MAKPERQEAAKPRLARSGYAELDAVGQTGNQIIFCWAMEGETEGKDILMALYI